MRHARLRLICAWSAYLCEEGLDIVPLEDLELGEHAHHELELVEPVVVLGEGEGEG